MMCYFCGQTMKTHRLIQIILAMLLPLVLCAGTASDRDYGITVTELPLLDRMPSRCVISLHQDAEGEMWYGTEDGLVRDNGHNIKVYYPTGTPDAILDDNKINCVTSDASGRIWLGTPKGAYILDKRNGVMVPVDNPRLREVRIHSLSTDSRGSIWIGTEGILYRLSPSGEITHEYPVSWNNRPTHINDIYEDSKGRLWTSLFGGGVGRLDPQKDVWEYYPWPFKEHAMRLAEDPSGKFFWLGTWLGGIVKFDPEATTTEEMFTLAGTTNKNDERDDAILYLERDDCLGLLWATTMNGLKVFDTADGTLRAVDGIMPDDEPYKMLTKIIKDRDGNLWVGGMNVPSFIISFSPRISTHSLEQIQRMSSHKPTISQTCIDDEPDKLWVFQERHRLYLYDLATGEVESEVASSFAATHNNVGSLYLMRKSTHLPGVWGCCLNPASIYRFTHTGGKIQVADHLDFSSGSAPRAIREDRRGLLWIGTGKDILTYNPATHRLSTVMAGIGPVNDIAEYPGGGIAVASGRPGGKSTISCFVDGKYSGKREYDLECTALAVSPDSTLWMGTRTGEIYRCRKDEEPEAISGISDFTRAGYISGMFIDRSGHLWAQSEQRISEIDPATLDMRHYYVNDSRIGLFNFFPKSYSILPNGNLIFGGTGGLCEFTPTNDFRGDVSPRRVYITGIKIDGEAVPIPAAGQTLEIKPSSSSLEIEFSSNEHIDAGHITYAYRMSGSNGAWVKLAPGINSIRLDHFPKGHFTFEVKCVTGGRGPAPGVCTLPVYQQPWFYETWWFSLLVILILGAIVTLLVRAYNRRKAAINEEKMKEELMQTKFRFFTNITHELRTPLTLIVTPLESMIRKCADGPAKSQLEGIRRNTYDLMNLINRILDFRRLEMGGERLALSKGDAAGFIMSICREFEPLAQQRGINFTFSSEVEPLFMEFDIEKLRMVVNNLLSNAFKFSEQGDTVSLELTTGTYEGRKSAVIKVSDTGIGIPADKLPHIFERFYQADQSNHSGAGSGIGLHLVNEYVKMHSGSITVKSEEGAGTEFTVNIPLYATDIEHAAGEIPAADNTRRSILIVEDNNEFREFMRTELSERYSVIDCPNAFDGERLAREHHPDIIISDVMMPGRDGYEFCRIIKNDVDTSDIPVILLTARSDYSAELSAYENQADAFVQKPFNLLVLFNRIDNLIALRERRQKEFQHQPASDFDKLGASPLDRRLLDKIMECVERNLSNSEYSVAELSADVNMSRMNLYRKLQSITGQTPSDLIKTIRLKKAAQMLLENTMNIVEVGYAVGYSTPSYFTRSFKAEFGMTPKQYIEKNRGN